jgi:NADH dehydrogenase (ubiquinone) Fe-S protein 1
MLLRRAVTAVHHPPLPHRQLFQCRQFSHSTTKRAEIELTIDGKKVRIEQGAALIQACEKAGVQIPRYYLLTCVEGDTIDIVIMIN